MLKVWMNTAAKQITPAEAETIVIQRRGLFARVDILAGTPITPEMVEPLRPATGIPPKQMKMVIGKRTKVDIPQGEPITWEKI